MTAKFETEYMDKALFNLNNVIEEAKSKLADIDFDTIVGTGFSGGVVIPALALAMGKKFVLVRKEDDSSHHGGGRLLGELGERWIFVDDFVSSGRTRDFVMRKMQNYRLPQVWNRELAIWEDAEEIASEFVGQYMYAYESPAFETAENASKGFGGYE